MAERGGPVEGNTAPSVNVRMQRPFSLHTPLEPVGPSDQDGTAGPVLGGWLTAYTQGETFGFRPEADPPRFNGPSHSQGVVKFSKLVVTISQNIRSRLCLIGNSWRECGAARCGCFCLDANTD